MCEFGSRGGFENLVIAALQVSMLLASNIKHCKSIVERLLLRVQRMIKFSPNNMSSSDILIRLAHLAQHAVI